VRKPFSNYRRIVVLTGAGVSAASGLRPYRGADGVWEEYNVQEYGHVDSLNERPEQTWQLFGPLREQIAAAEPNPAHFALAAFESGLDPSQQFVLVTQNVDALHQRAGSRWVVELHGNLGRTRCANAACQLHPFADSASHCDAVPRCPLCGHVLRPDVVLFGERLPASAEWSAKTALRDCDLFLAIGTSGVVTPAANFVRSAQYAGAHTVYVNLEPMRPRNPMFKEEHYGRAEDLLPRLLEIG
jgi:NAD-dependent deacetylase